MRKLAALFVMSTLLIAWGSAPAGAGAAKAARRHQASKAAPERITYQSEKGRQAVTAAAAAGASVGGGAVGGGGASVQADFDDDGRLDLAVGAPDEDYGATNDGFVQVIYGSATGLVSAGNQGFGESDFTIAVNEEAFGQSLAAGDFDGDGFGDLAVGIPEWDGGVANGGSVLVVYGSAAGLNIGDRQQLFQGTGGAADSFEVGDQFGFSLVAANFGNGGQTDLAVGVPGEDSSFTDDGAIHVFYGTPGGLDSAGDAFLTQDSSLVEDVSEPGDNFGHSLAAANLGQSAQFDLAVGAPFDDVGVAVDAGMVNVLFGSADGITALNDQLWHQDRDGVKDVAEEADSFGIALAAANFGKSSQADLAVGAYLEGQSGPADIAGAVQVLYGGSAGLSAAGNQVWHQNVSGIADTAEAIDLFGWSLAAANFGKSSQADLAIGVPIETIGAAGATGAVHVLYGTSTGLKAAGSQFWHQNTTGIAGSNANSDTFGWALEAANFGKSSQADLAIGAPGDVVGGVAAGAVNVLYGTSTGLKAAGNQRWHQDVGSIVGVAEAGDDFGGALG